MSSMLDNSDLFPMYPTTQKANMPISRVAQQLSTLQAIEPIIGNAGKITMTPTRIRIMSEHKAGAAFQMQQERVNAHLGTLPFTVELVPHG